MNALAQTALPPVFDRARHVAQRALMLGGILCLVALVTDYTRFFQSYLVGYLYWISISLGCLGALLLHHLVGGIWGFVLRRPAEAGVSTFPLMALLFLPIAIGMKLIYPWVGTTDPHIVAKASYLNTVAFLVRTAIYFGFWIAVAAVLRRGMRAQDQTTSPAPTRGLQTVSGPGIAFFFLTSTFAFMDWGMTLEPKWFSTIYGPMLLVGAVLATLSLLVIVASWLAPFEPFSKVAIPRGFHDVGNLMLAFTMLWAYISFSQYLITYSGNTAEEIPWYLHRSVGIWRPTAAILMLFQFFAPFFLLLGRDRKRNAQSLAKVAVWILVMRLIDLTWIVIPAYGWPLGHEAAAHGAHAAHAAAPVATEGFRTIISSIAGVLGSFALVGGLWGTFFLRRLDAIPALPSENNPLFAKVVAHLHHGHDHGHGHAQPNLEPGGGH